LTITGADKTKIYGSGNPPLTGTITGLKNADGISAGYSTAATQASDVGSYAITPAAVDRTPAKLANYDLTLVNGSLSITKAPLDVTADARNKVYGATNPSFTASYGGFRLGQTLANSGVSGSPSLTTAAD